MGCVSSKLVKKQLIREIRVNNGGDHIVSLTSTTYGFLKLEGPVPQLQGPDKDVVLVSDKPKRSPPCEEPEIINAWELMEDLEDSMPVSQSQKISPKSRGLFGKSWMSPMKSAEKMESPKRSKRFGGKENKGTVGNGLNSRGVSPSQVLKPRNVLETPKRGVLRLSFPLKSEEQCKTTSSQRRKSFSPLFDPDLVASYERELCQEQEQIKTVISPLLETVKPKKTQEIERILGNFPEKCPPGGENSVVIYTTTLRGIRKTFEECNTVRSIFESHQIQLSERDVSMHSGFKDEIRCMMGTKLVKIPAVFIKGRLIGGMEEVLKMEEEGKLGMLLEGIPAARVGGGCRGCGGLRFVMCVVCNGSCKVRDEEKKKMERCLECNENGLILCPFCP